MTPVRGRYPWQTPSPLVITLFKDLFLWVDFCTVKVSFGLMRCHFSCYYHRCLIWWLRPQRKSAQQPSCPSPVYYRFWQHIIWLWWVFILFWPSDIMWWHKTVSTLVQVMAWCLMAPSHCLNQCWLNINDIHLHPPDGNIQWKYSIYYSLKMLKITHLKSLPHLTGTKSHLSHFPHLTYSISSQFIFPCMLSHTCCQSEM